MFVNVNDHHDQLKGNIGNDFVLLNVYCSEITAVYFRQTMRYYYTINVVDYSFLFDDQRFFVILSHPKSKKLKVLFSCVLKESPITHCVLNVIVVLTLWQVTYPPGLAKIFPREE